MTNMRKMPSVEGRMRTMRNSTVKQDTSVLFRDIKESVKGKDSSVEGCRGQPLSEVPRLVTHTASPWL